MTWAAVPAHAYVPGPGRRGPLFTGLCVRRVDQAAHAAVQLVDAAGRRGRHGRVRCPAVRRLRKAPDPAGRAALDPAAYSESGFFLAQLAIGVLGVLAITGE